MQPNKRVYYFRCDHPQWAASIRCNHMDAGIPLEQFDDFVDPYLQWVKQKDGSWQAVGLYGGEPLESWLKANPKPGSLPGLR